MLGKGQPAGFSYTATLPDSPQTPGPGAHYGGLSPLEAVGMKGGKWALGLRDNHIWI